MTLALLCNKNKQTRRPESGQREQLTTDTKVNNRIKNYIFKKNIIWRRKPAEEREPPKTRELLHVRGSRLVAISVPKIGSNNCMKKERINI